MHGVARAPHAHPARIYHEMSRFAHLRSEKNGKVKKLLF
jgi:hypothetical protein